MRRVVQTWLLAFFVLFSGVSQSSLVSALLNGQATGIANVSATGSAEDSDYVLICTPAGIKLVLFDKLEAVVQPDAPDQPDKIPAHAFCPLCANHHGAMTAIDLPYIAPVPVIHDVSYAKAFALVVAYKAPCSRHSRAPPVSI